MVASLPLSWEGKEIQRGFEGEGAIDVSEWSGNDGVFEDRASRFGSWSLAVHEAHPANGDTGGEMGDGYCFKCMSSAQV